MQQKKSINRQEHFSYTELLEFLRMKKDGNVNNLQAFKYKDHLENCMACWFSWNKARWDEAKESRGLKELKIYLGKKFIHYFDSSWAIAAKWNEMKPETDEEIAHFYKIADEYLYNLVIWHESGDRECFSKQLRRLTKEFNIKSVIDFGCGVGTDGLWLLENNFEVNFVDFHCPSIEFLRWRMKKRRLKAEISDIQTLDKLPDKDMFWAIDVLEHVPDPLSIVSKLSENTKLFVHRSQFNNTSSGRHPCHISFNEIRLSRALKKRGFMHVPWNQLSVWVKKQKV